VPLDRQTRYFPINKNSPISAGSKAYALGYPFIMNLSIADGLISRVYEDGDGDAERKAGADIKFWKWGIQHNIAINGGNSGGPTISESGVVIGISTFGYLEKDGLNFSINVSSIFECISDKSNLEEISIQPLVKKLALRAIESAGYG
jgi:serine protease Do